jgi:hypothetical protein
MDRVGCSAVKGVGPEIHVSFGLCSNARKRGKQYRLLRYDKHPLEPRTWLAHSRYAICRQGNQGDPQGNADFQIGKHELYSKATRKPGNTVFASKL